MPNSSKLGHHSARDGSTGHDKSLFGDDSGQTLKNPFANARPNTPKMASNSEKSTPIRRNPKFEGMNE